MNLKNKNKGVSILGILILCFIVVLILSYYNVSIKDVVESPKAQENINYVGGGAKSVWDKYLKDPAIYIWDKVIVDLLWDSFILNMERVKDGKATEFQELAPQISSYKN